MIVEVRYKTDDWRFIKGKLIEETDTHILVEGLNDQKKFKIPKNENTVISYSKEVKE